MRCLRLALLPVLLVALVLAGCVGDSPGITNRSQPSRTDSIATIDASASNTGSSNTGSSGASSANTGASPDAVTTTTTLPGRVTNPENVQVGNCFSRFVLPSSTAQSDSTDADSTATETIFIILDCAQPHDGEIYHQATYEVATPSVANPETANTSAADPETTNSVSSNSATANQGIPYPGDLAIQEWGEQECYDNFASWVGELYEISVLEFDSFLPTADTWEETNTTSRKLSCYIKSADGERLVGSRYKSGI